MCLVNENNLVLVYATSYKTKPEIKIQHQEVNVLDHINERACKSEGAACVDDNFRFLSLIIYEIAHQLNEI